MINSVKECPETLAFATEPVLGSLANVLAYKEQLAASANQSTNSVPHQQHQNPHQNPSHRPVMIKQYDMLAMEIKYGLLQVKKFFLNIYTFWEAAGPNFREFVESSSSL